MAGRKAKRSEIWDSGTLVTHTCIWVHFGLVVFMVTLGSFSVLVSNWAITSKRLVVEPNGVKFGTRAKYSAYMRYI